MKRLLDYLGVFFGITTVVGLVLAYYWHAQSVQERVPMYYVSPERTTIVDTSVPTPSQLQVLYKGKNINMNVSAVIVYLWNDGKLPIRGGDVLDAIKVQLSPATEIIDARLLKVSRPVTKFTKGEVSDTEKNSLPLSFGILEQGDGAALQIIYAGTVDAKVSVIGTIVGAREPRVLTSAADHFARRTRSEMARTDRGFAYVAIPTMALSTAHAQIPRRT